MEGRNGDQNGPLNCIHDLHIFGWLGDFLWRLSLQLLCFALSLLGLRDSLCGTCAAMGSVVLVGLLF